MNIIHDTGETGTGECERPRSVCIADTRYKWGWAWDHERARVSGRISHSMLRKGDHYTARCGVSLNETQGVVFLFGNPGPYASRCRRCQDLASPYFVERPQEPKPEPRVHRRLVQKNATNRRPWERAPTDPKPAPRKTQDRLPFWARPGRDAYNPDVRMR